MKKVILSLVVVAALSTACKKNYTCTCTITDPGFPTTTTTATIKDTKSKATTACNAGNATVGTESVSCVIN